MGKLLGTLWSAVLYFSFATVIALGLMAGHLMRDGRLSSQSWSRLLAPPVAAVSDDAKKTPTPAEQGVPPEQVSLEQVAEARAIKSRDLELREQALSQGLASLEAQRFELTQEKQLVQRTRTNFVDELQKYRDQLSTEGAQNVQSIVENVKPKQAKQLLTGMIAEGQMDRAITLLASMPTDKKKKIAAEFKTPEEAKQLQDMLKLMEEGVPENSAVEQAEGEMQSASDSGTKDSEI